MKRPQIVEQIRKALAQVVPDAQAILYGSEARGEARPDSDIDLLILVDGNELTVKEEDRIIAPLYDIEIETGVQINARVLLKKIWENRPFQTPFIFNEGRDCAMKERLDRENIEALAAYRFQRAEETLKEIPYLKQQGYYNTAVNRLYYACYYAAVALLIKHELNPGTHAGVKQMLGLHFVATGRLSRELGRCFSLLFERRHSSDYDDFAYSSEEEIDELLPKATDFIEAVGVLLKE